METISYLNLKVDGTPITKIVSLKIEHMINDHATAEVVGETDLTSASSFVKRADETTKIMITTKAKGQPSILFHGVVASAGVEKQGAYALLHLTLKSTSYLLDIKQQNKSFQNTGKTHEQILKEAYKNQANLSMNVSDKPIGSLIMQYNETNWQFTKRIAANFNAPVITNIITDKPDITIGLPPAGKSYTLKDVEYDYSSILGGGTKITGNQYVYLGDSVTYEGKTERVKGISATIESGILRSTLLVSDNKGFQAEHFNKSIGSGLGSGMAAGMNGSMSGATSLGGGFGNSMAGGSSQTTNGQVSGKMFTGIVQAVKKDKVQVHLVDIDAEYDGGGDYWFPYSTAYSSSDGSGFYCMPSEGDTVRVFFPSGKEGEAFAASSVNVSPLDNPKHKKWRSPAGKEILMTEEGIFITCKENRIFINLTEEDGITISSDKDINITSQSNVSVTACKELVLEADNNILLSTAESYIDMRPEKIELGASNVTIS